MGKCMLVKRRLHGVNENHSIQIWKEFHRDIRTKSSMISCFEDLRKRKAISNMKKYLSLLATVETSNRKMLEVVFKMAFGKILQATIRTQSYKTRKSKLVSLASNKQTRSKMEFFRGAKRYSKLCKVIESKANHHNQLRLMLNVFLGLKANTFVEKGAE